MSRYTIVENNDDDWMLEHKRMDIERKRLAELDEVVRENNALREQRDFLIKENENLQLKIEEVQQLEQTQRFLLQTSDAYKSGREEERVAIVFWLRGEHDDDYLAACLAGAADDIEAGFHLRGDDE